MTTLLLKLYRATLTSPVDTDTTRNVCTRAMVYATSPEDALARLTGFLPIVEAQPAEYTVEEVPFEPGIVMASVV